MPIGHRDTSKQGSDASAGLHGPDYGQVEQEPGRGHVIGHKRERRPDGEVRKELWAKLEADDELDVSNADVLVSDGVVVLLGSVSEYAMKRRIEHLCESVSGVQEIHDQLLVGPVNVDAEPGGLHTEAPRAGFRGPHA